MQDPSLMSLPRTTPTTPADARRRFPADSEKRRSRGPALADVQAMATSFAGSRDPAIRAEIVAAYRKYVTCLAARLRRSGEPLEDLVQVGTLGLIRALDGYDPRRGAGFAAYATPSIVGEIRHHLRDNTGHVKVPRTLQERLFDVKRAERELNLHPGRPPTIAAIAARLDLSEEAVLEAMEMGRNMPAVSLDAVFEGPDGSRSALKDQIGAPDAALHDMVVYEALRQALKCLSPREQEIIHLRFFEDLSQEEIAEKVSLSQMHVSRLIRRALGRLHGILGE